MPDWQMQADTQGIGELIEHRRLLRVPDHQREYAWSADVEVEQFLDDITREMMQAGEDYFLGLVVLVTPIDGDAWGILDGQQRLATTTMIYAAIREWLHAAGLEKDANTIQSNFIGGRGSIRSTHKNALRTWRSPRCARGSPADSFHRRS